MIVAAESLFELRPQRVIEGLAIGDNHLTLEKSGIRNRTTGIHKQTPVHQGGVAYVNVGGSRQMKAPPSDVSDADRKVLPDLPLHGQVRFHFIRSVGTILNDDGACGGAELRRQECRRNTINREIKPEFERMAPGSVGEAFLYLIAFFIQDYPQLDIERSL